MSREFQRGLNELRAARVEQNGLLVAAFIFSVFVNILMLTGPLYMLQVYDRVLGSRSEPTLAPIRLRTSSTKYGATDRSGVGSPTTISGRAAASVACASVMKPLSTMRGRTVVLRRASVRSGLTNGVRRAGVWTCSWPIIFRPIAAYTCGG